jgi:hypothetical protein
MSTSQMPFSFISDVTNRRAAMNARWIILVRDILPEMAEHCAWPITQDHCFMRVCLDTALGAPWHTAIKRPAIRHLSDAQLDAAIAVAEALVRHPGMLATINRRSIEVRRAQLVRRT